MENLKLEEIVDRDGHLDGSVSCDLARDKPQDLINTFCRSREQALSPIWGNPAINEENRRIRGEKP